MRNKTLRALCSSLFFAFAGCVLGPYQIGGVSVAVAVALLAGVSTEPLFALLSVALYLLAGIWLPVYPGNASGTAVLLGSSGGFLLSLLLCALVISALRSGLRRHPFLAALAGLCAAFLLYFGIGILWYTVRTGVSLQSVLTSRWATPCLLFGLDALLALLASPTLFRATS